MRPRASPWMAPVAARGIRRDFTDHWSALCTGRARYGMCSFVLAHRRRAGRTSVEGGDVMKVESAARGSSGGVRYALTALAILAFAGCGDGRAIKQVEEVSGKAAKLTAISSWRQFAATPFLDSTAFTYDSKRKTVWHFELDTRTTEKGLYAARMWEWDGATWTRRPETGARGTTGPGLANTFAVMTYDSVHDRIVLVGGSQSIEVWLWNGAGWTLAPSYPPEIPVARNGQAIAFAAGRAQLVLFGGAGPNGDLSDTWTWNGTDWTQRAKTGPVPPGGAGVRMVYDPDRGRTVLLSAGSTWEWDGAVWEQRAQATAAPLRGTMTYDAGRKAGVLYVGDAGQNQLWRWDGQSWTEQPSATATPAVNEIAYDGARDRIVLFGSAKTWEWDGASWTVRMQAPPPQSAPVMPYARARQAVVVFGNNVMWTWNGARWLPKPFTDGPASTPSPVIAYDDLRQKVVLFNGETWEWDGTTWDKRVPAGTSPPGGFAMAYDSGHGVIVLLDSTGGTVTTWTWDGTTWTHLAASTEPTLGGAVAYDNARNELVMYVSPGRRRTGPGQTWEWDGSGWSLRSPAPYDQSPAGLAYDADRGTVVLVSNAIWEWDGQTWTRLDGTEGPGPRYRPGLAYDSARKALVLFGGGDLIESVPPFGDTRELRSGCSSNDQCPAGTCVDGVCCDTTEPSCGACRACNVPGSEGVCTPTTGPCDDGNACTQVDTCPAGQCVGSAPVSCASQGECQLAGTCDPATGACSNPPAADGAPCSGMISATPPSQGGQCLAHICLGGACRC